MGTEGNEGNKEWKLPIVKSASFREIDEVPETLIEQIAHCEIGFVSKIRPTPARRASLGVARLARFGIERGFRDPLFR